MFCCVVSLSTFTRCLYFVFVFLLVVCILTRPTGSSKYGTTRKNTQRYYTTKRLIRYICCKVNPCFSVQLTAVVNFSASIQVLGFCTFRFECFAAVKRLTSERTLEYVLITFEKNIQDVSFDFFGTALAFSLSLWTDAFQNRSITSSSIGLTRTVCASQSSFNVERKA